MMRCITELIGSLCDWQLVWAASRHFNFVVNGCVSPLKQSVAKFHTALCHSGCRFAEIVVEESSKSSPDGYKVFFALRSILVESWCVAVGFGSWFWKLVSGVG